MKFILSTIGIIFLVNVLVAQKPLSKSDMVKLDFNILAANKSKLQAKDPSLLPAFRQLLKGADNLLNYQPVSVMDKKELPPSGNKHDYMSIGPYWWPDPSKPNGIPYMRKDGEVNPEVRSYPDKENMPKLCENVYVLGLAYYFSGDEKYAKHAGKLLQVWFLDSATRMNPNLNYGQAIKGITTGRAEGLIESRHFIFAIDAIELIGHSKSWSVQNQTGMKKWFTEFLSWMQTSEIGIDEMNAKNNHGVWYDAQRLAIALFIGDQPLANSIVLNAADRLDKQSDANGSFPLEMERTTSFHYTVFILNAFEIIAQLSEETGTNFRTLETASGKSFKKSFEAVLPFITQQKPWTGKQIKAFSFPDAFPLLSAGSKKLNCVSCMEAIKNIAGEGHEQLLLNLL